MSSSTSPPPPSEKGGTPTVSTTEQVPEEPTSKPSSEAADATGAADDTTPEQDNNDNKKRKKQKKQQYSRGRNKKRGKSKQGNNDNDSKPSSKQPRHRKEYLNCSWKIDGIQIHGGSYAHADMQTLFPEKKINAEEETKTNKDDPQQTTTTTTKRRVALLVGYVGSKYSGFQMNPDVKTIQAELELALYASKCILSTNFGCPNKYSWSTSGRTDKGVHAAAQVVSMKMELLSTETTFDVVRDRINQNMSSPDIRVLDIARTTRSFCAKTQRDRVRYQYLIPSWIFHPDLVNILGQVHKQKKKQEEENPTGLMTANDNNNDDNTNSDSISLTPLTEVEVKSIQERMRSYRVSPTQLELLNTALEKYQGTHSFHNFTRRLKPNDPSAKRYIVQFHCTTDPQVIVDEHGYEWISTSVTGQSFLLNQIRKMVSLAMDVARGQASDQDLLFQAVFDSSKSVRIGMAPAQGLFLDMSFYEQYNTRQKQNNLHQKSDKTDLDWWIPGTPAHTRWKEFRDNVILKHVFQEEYEQGNFVHYIYNQEYMFLPKNSYRIMDVNTATAASDDDDVENLHGGSSPADETTTTKTAATPSAAAAVTADQMTTDPVLAADSTAVGSNKNNSRSGEGNFDNDEEAKKEE